MKAIDLTGKTSGPLTALYDTGNRSGGNAIWKCRCVCGLIVYVQATKFRFYATRKCTCNDSTIYVLYKRYKTDARRNNREFTLSREQFKSIIFSTCHYCGRAPYREFRGHECKGTIKYNGMDRYDNSLGYTIQNIVPCCFECNRAKSTMTPQQFIFLCRLVSEHKIANTGVTEALSTERLENE